MLIIHYMYRIPSNQVVYIIEIEIYKQKQINNIN